MFVYCAYAFKNCELQSKLKFSIFYNFIYHRNGIDNVQSFFDLCCVMTSIVKISERSMAIDSDYHESFSPAT